MITTPPLQEVQRLIKAFMDAKTSTSIDLQKISKLVDKAINEHDTELKEYGEFCVAKWIGAESVSLNSDIYKQFKLLKSKLS